MHEVFICYTPEDEEIAKEICDFFEQKGIRCWFKKRDYSEEDSVSKIIDVIRDSKSVVLVYSDNARNSNFVITEIDVAFSSNIPIVVFNIDDSSISSKLEFYLSDKPSIDAFPNAKQHFEQLFKDTTELWGSSDEKLTKHDVFICYGGDDILTSDAICHVLEENNISCWYKKRDFKVNDSIQKIKDSIKYSKSVVLVYSQEAMKSNYVNTEIAIANSLNIPIVSFKVDDSNVDKTKDWKNLHWLDAFPDSGKHFKDLVSVVSKLVGKEIDNPLISQKFENFKIEKNSSESEKTIVEDTPTEFSKDYGIGKNFKRITIATVAIISVLLIFTYLSYYIFLPGLTDGSVVISDDEVNINFGGDEYSPPLNISFGDVVDSGSNYEISAKVNEMPDDFDDYSIETEFIDGSGVVIDSTNVSVKNLNIGDDGTLKIVDYDYNEDISKISVRIYDGNYRMTNKEVFTVSN